jgi:hypothetical protein
MKTWLRFLYYHRQKAAALASVLGDGRYLAERRRCRFLIGLVPRKLFKAEA